MCKECIAPRNREDSRPYASSDAGREIGLVLNIEITTIIDVPVNEIHRHNSDIVNYSSSLRTMEENLNNVCSESSKPAVVNHEQGSQDSNNVKTKVEPSSVHRER